MLENHRRHGNVPCPADVSFAVITLLHGSRSGDRRIEPVVGALLVVNFVSMSGRVPDNLSILSVKPPFEWMVNISRWECAAALVHEAR